MSCAVKAFPLRASRLVDVDVRVDHSGHDDVITGIDDLNIHRHIIPRSNPSDSSAIDMDRRCAQTIEGQYTLTSDHAIHYSACSNSIPGATIVITYTNRSATRYTIRYS